MRTKGMARVNDTVDYGVPKLTIRNYRYAMNKLLRWWKIWFSREEKTLMPYVLFKYTIFLFRLLWQYLNTIVKV